MVTKLYRTITLHSLKPDLPEMWLKFKTTILQNKSSCELKPETESSINHMSLSVGSLVKCARIHLSYSEFMLTRMGCIIVQGLDKYLACNESDSGGSK